MNIREVMRRNRQNIQMTALAVIGFCLVAVAQSIVLVAVVGIVLVTVSMLLKLQPQPPSGWRRIQYAILAATGFVAAFRVVMALVPALETFGYYVGESAWLLPNAAYVVAAILAVATGVAIIAAFAWLAALAARKMASAFRRACRRKR